MYFFFNMPISFSTLLPSILHLLPTIRRNIKESRYGLRDCDFCCKSLYFSTSTLPCPNSLLKSIPDYLATQTRLSFRFHFDFDSCFSDQFDFNNFYPSTVVLCSNYWINLNLLPCSMLISSKKKLFLELFRQTMCMNLKHKYLYTVELQQWSQ